MEHPKTFEEFVTYMAKHGVVRLHVKWPGGETHINDSIDLWDLPAIQLAYEQIAVGADGWELNFRSDTNV